MLDAMWAALVILADPQVLLFILAGALIGIFVGLMPGLGTITSVALLLPLVVVLPPKVGLSFLMGVISTTGIADCIVTILIAIPGEGPAIVTILDGYPMNRRGEGARAIGASIFASMLGSLCGVALTVALVMLIRPIVIAFGSAELFMAIVLGLSFVTVLSGSSIIKGLLAAGIGLVLSMVGYDPRSGMERFTFDIMFFYEGFNIAVLGLGLFGVAVMYETLSEGEPTISFTKTLPKLRDVLRGGRDVLDHWRVFCMSTVVATVMGAIPGLGKMASAWVTYGLARKMSKNPEAFGTGCVEGVIASETANNSTTAGALLTTLSFGVPGSAVMSLFLGALIMTGLTPGPALIRDHLHMVYLLIFGIAFANLVAGTITLLTASHLAKIAFVPMDYLFPALMSLIMLAAYVTQGSLLTMLPLCFGAVLGIAMKKFRYPVGPLVLAFVLGRIFEYYLFNAFDFWGTFFFLRPISVAIMVIIFAIFGGGPLLRYIKRRMHGTMATAPMELSQDIKIPLNTKGILSHVTGMRLEPSTYFPLIVMVVMVVLIGKALTFHYYQPAILPVIAGILVFVLAGIQVAREILGKGGIKTQKEPKLDGEIENTKGMSLGIFAVWFLGFCLAIYVFGHLIAVSLFCLSYVKLRGKSWVSSVVATGCITAFIYIVFPLAFDSALYPGLISELISGE